MRHLPSLAIAAFTFACSGSSGGIEGSSDAVKDRNDAPSQQASSPPSAAAPSLDGDWDVTALSNVLAPGESGTISIRGGEITVELPMAIPEWSNGYDEAVGCAIASQQFRLTLSVKGDVATGLAHETTTYGPDCRAASSGGWSTSVYATRAKASTNRGAFDGGWKIKVGERAYDDTIKVDGTSFKIADVVARTILSGGLAGAQFTASGEGVAFAARRR